MGVEQILVFIIFWFMGFVLGYLLATITVNRNMMKEAVKLKTKYAELNDEWEKFHQDVMEAIKKMEDKE